MLTYLRIILAMLLCHAAIAAPLDAINNNPNIIFISPASTVSEEQYKLIKKAVPQSLPSCYTKSTEPYLAAPDAMRVKELNQALAGEKYYIWAVRGGYGSARLFDKIKKPKQPKVIIGYSDITFLHLLADKWGWKSIHGTMVYDLARSNWDPENMVMLSKMLTDGKGHLAYSGLTPFNQQAAICNKVEGKTLGGNLTLLAASLGTDWQMDGKGKILLIEDTGEKGYTLDRRFLQLTQAGVFKDAKAVILGQFDGDDPNIGYALKQFATSIHIPVFKTNFFGHGSKNWPIPLGFISEIVKNKENFTLKINYDFRK